MKDKIIAIAKQFIQYYFITKEADKVLDMLAEHATWSGFPGDSSVLSKETVGDRLHEFLEKKRTSNFEIIDEEYSVISYNESQYVIACTVSGVIQETDVSLRRKFELTIETSEEQPILCVQINPILDPNDFAYLDNLTKSADQLEIIRSIIQFGMLVCEPDRDFTIISMDDNICRMFGYSKDEIMEKFHGKAGELIYGDDYDSALADIDKQFSHSNEYSSRYRVVKKDGTQMWVWDSGFKTVDENHKPIIQALLADITALVNLQKERDTTFENIPGGVAYIDVGEKDFTVRDANDNYFQMLGVERDEYLIENIRYTYPEDLPRLREHMSQQARKREPIDFEFREKLPYSGETRWYRMIGRYYMDRGQMPEYLCIMTDVTEQKRTVALLALEKERYRIAMRSSADIVYEYKVDTDELTLYPGKAAHEKTIAVDKGTFSNWREILFERNLVHPDDRDVIFSLMKIKEYSMLEMRLLTVHDEDETTGYEWYQVHANIVQNKDGGIERVFGLIQNVNEQKEYSAESEELKQIFDMQLSNNYERIIKVDLRNKEYKLYTNESGKYYGLLKYGNYAATLENMAEKFLYKDDKRRYCFSMSLERMEELLNSGEEEVTRFFRILSNDGQYRWKCYRYSYYGVDMETILLNVQDVHDIRMEEQKNENANRRILIDALEEAKKASVTRKNFITMVSKEVRNPLQIVREMSNISEEEMSQPDTVQKNMAMINEAANYLWKIAGDLTEIGELDKGNIPIGKAPMDLYLLIQEIVQEQIRIADQNEVKFIFDMKISSTRTYFGDEFRVRQVIGNVLANSVRFSPRGEKIVVHILEHDLDERQTTIHIKIEDMGVHVDADTFERIYQEDGKSIFSMESTIGENTGFSLMLCKEIVELMGGSASIEYGNREENYFSLELPLEYKEENMQHKPRKQTNEIEESKPEVDLSAYSILLVQNTSGRNRLLGALLRVNGARVDIASTAREAMSIWNIYAEDGSHAILMDTTLPDMDCGDLASMIRDSDKSDSKKVPIIVMTENVVVEDMKRGYQKGINASISKPVDLHRLLQLLQVIRKGIVYEN